jgi:hypothetical protein
MRLVDGANVPIARERADRAAFWLTLIASAPARHSRRVGGAWSPAIRRGARRLGARVACALGPGGTLVIAISTTLGARSGLLVRTAAEQEARADDSRIRRTGTLLAASSGGRHRDRAVNAARRWLTASVGGLGFARGIIKSAEEQKLTSRGPSSSKRFPVMACAPSLKTELFMGRPAC